MMMQAMKLSMTAPILIKICDTCSFGIPLFAKGHYQISWDAL